MDSTTIAAWVGAVVSIVVLAWDVIKWFNDGPKIKKLLLLERSYDDSKVIKTEILEEGVIQKELETYCHVELINVGNLPTTIMGISGSHKKNGKHQLFVNGEVFSPHFGHKLPYVLNPGNVWSCRLPMKYYHHLLEYSDPFIQVTVSHLNKPIILRASRLTNKSLQLTTN